MYIWEIVMFTYPDDIAMWEASVAVSAYPPFSIPGGTLKLVSAYRG